MARPKIHALSFLLRILKFSYSLLKQLEEFLKLAIVPLHDLCANAKTEPTHKRRDINASGEIRTRDTYVSETLARVEDK
jgi:hypothetical protein